MPVIRKNWRHYATRDPLRSDLIVVSLVVARIVFNAFEQIDVIVGSKWKFLGMIHEF